MHVFCNQRYEKAGDTTNGCLIEWRYINANLKTDNTYGSRYECVFALLPVPGSQFVYIDDDYK